MVSLESPYAEKILDTLFGFARVARGGCPNHAQCGQPDAAIARCPQCAQNGTTGRGGAFGQAVGDFEGRDRVCRSTPERNGRQRFHTSRVVESGRLSPTTMAQAPACLLAP